MTEESETFAEWLEQLELVAVACHWDEPTKLVKLVTRLKGQAFAFYRSCNATQRTQYPAPVAELKKRFMPVHIQAVQSSLFHDRKTASRRECGCLCTRTEASFLQSLLNSSAGKQGDREYGEVNVSVPVCLRATVRIEDKASQSGWRVRVAAGKR